MMTERSVFSNDLHKSVNLSSFQKIIFKDTLKAFDDFKNKQQKCMK